jgi:hypothetical protein
MNPAIQTEIARQVALALQLERDEHHVTAAQNQPAKGARLITFPGAS